ncbi:DUF3592 domain-containing protein [Enterococcus gallinarum]|uniref:DUF3592 domain-containing protein n=1 Tax=Enterococcus gallinarum TaxID=1353 RepID=UPI00214B98D5|nr:hypothetical protein [Enterococcus gallinarum]MCR1943345.1 hypothetical protein [Enterococcus gallinarum]
MSNIEKKEVIGTVVETSTILPDVVIRNTKWATFSYEIDGQYYVSENSITIPMRYDVGDTMTIKYNVKKPTEIFPKHLFVT